MSLGRAVIMALGREGGPSACGQFRHPELSGKKWRQRPRRKRARAAAAAASRERLELGVIKISAESDSMHEMMAA